MRLILFPVLLMGAQIAFGQAPAAAPAAATTAVAPDQKNGFSGKVTETMKAGDYTYVQIDTGSNKVWAAAPQFAVKVGDTAAVPAGMPMEKYHSKILDRDFDVVYFADRVIVNGGAAGGKTAELPAGHPPIPGVTAPSTNLPAGHPPINGASASKSARAKVDLTGIKKAEGGRTVAEVYAQKAKLKGKETTVRGKVVKFNSSIMGKNWVHIQDGTGKTGVDNDLLVTTDKEVKVGDTVLVSGKVSLDKDFGANYKYEVMIEDGKITTE